MEHVPVFIFIFPGITGFYPLAGVMMMMMIMMMMISVFYFIQDMPLIYIYSLHSRIIPAKHEDLQHTNDTFVYVTLNISQFE